MSLHKEIEFESDICTHLGASGWLYSEGDAAQYDRARALLVSLRETSSLGVAAFPENSSINSSFRRGQFSCRQGVNLSCRPTPRLIAITNRATFSSASVALAKAEGIELVVRDDLSNWPLMLD